MGGNDRIPLIISATGLARSERSNHPVGLIDLFTTLNELCGLPRKEDLEGVSLKSLLKDPSADRDRPALCTFGPNNHSLRSERWRYTRFADGSEELYVHDNDPHEWNNLAGDLKFKTVVAGFQKFLPPSECGTPAGSAGSDSPLYGEGKISLQEAMDRAQKKN